MRTIRIYQAGSYEKGQTIELSASSSQHVAMVLRMQPGDSLTLFSGDNHEFLARITEVHKKKVWVTIQEREWVNRESPSVIHLAQAISKGDRMEWVVQKAVELGVTTITPLLTAHCVVRLDAERLAKKQAQWQAIAIAACEQCGRNQLPLIHEASTLQQYLQNCQAPNKFILTPTATQSWRDSLLPIGDLALVIGPEGGLSDEEVSQARAAQFQPRRLGPRILRTETAAIAALAVLQAMIGDL